MSTPAPDRSGRAARMVPDATSAPLPGQDTLILSNHNLRRGTAADALSRFADPRWVLTPALFQDDADALSLDFSTVPVIFQYQVKLLTWFLINRDGADPTAFMPRPAIRSVATTFGHLRDFTQWLTDRSITTLAGVTASDLDSYAAHINASTLSHHKRQQHLAAVVRAWNLRHLMPQEGRLPAAAPWGGDRTRDIVGPGQIFDENRTPRIHPATMTGLLSWCLRFIEEFADDIIAAFDEYKTLSARTPRERLRQGEQMSARRPPGSLTYLVSDLLADYRARGIPLPGRLGPDGQIIVNAYHLGLQIDAQLHTPRIASLIQASGLPIAQDTYSRAPITAQLDARPWLNQPITHDQSPIMARHLSTACFIAIAYLSGQRAGETLNLERGCIHHDPASGLLMLRGRHWKGVRDAAGSSKPEGEQRQDPWTVVAPVATAVSVLERLHDAHLLFPNTLNVDGRARSGRLKDRVGRARGSSSNSIDITRFIMWVNDYCRTNARTDAIPADQANPEIYASRLRRTLAWFIVRQPRGLVAAAIQYGHVKVKMTLGYSGSYASGFPDDLAFEEWLERIDRLTDAHERLNNGEHVSGPAADEYRARVSTSSRFAGQTLRTRREAAALMANTELQIYPGKGMSCVLDPVKAACRLAADERSTLRTPDISDCRPHCGNIARTDRDIDYLRGEVVQLQDAVRDSLAPPIRHAREQHELERLARIITRHEGQAPG
jgi:integrase